MEQKHIPLPFVFLKYFITDQNDITSLEKLGMKNTRVILSDGSVIIQSEDIPICHVLPCVRRKRNDPYDTPDEQRDAIAEFIVRACNSHDDLVAALEKARQYVVQKRDDQLEDDSFGNMDGEYAKYSNDFLKSIDLILSKAKGEQ